MSEKREYFDLDSDTYWFIDSKIDAKLAETSYKKDSGVVMMFAEMTKFRPSKESYGDKLYKKCMQLADVLATNKVRLVSNGLWKERAKVDDPDVVIRAFLKGATKQYIEQEDYHYLCIEMGWIDAHTKFTYKDKAR